MARAALKVRHLFFLIKHSERGKTGNRQHFLQIARQREHKKTSPLLLLLESRARLDSQMEWRHAARDSTDAKKDSDFREDSEANLGESKTRTSPIPLCLSQNWRDRDKQRTDGMGASLQRFARAALACSKNFR